MPHAPTARDPQAGPVPVPLVPVACPLCGGRDIRHLASMPDLVLGTPGLFPLARCAGCGLLHQNPRMREDQIERAYPPHYAAHGRDPHLTRLWRKHRAAVLWRLRRRHGYRHLDGAPAGSRLARLVAPVAAWWQRDAIDITFPPWTGGGRLLDVGCATGVYLRQAREAGWHVAGIEIDPEAAARARSVTPEILCGDIATAPFAPGSFDVITSFHVVEHLVDPVGALRQLVGWLAPGGLLILEVPNVAGVGGRLFGRYWSGLDFPRHLVHFTPETMAAMVVKAGGRVVRAQHRSKPRYVVLSVRHLVAARRDPLSRALGALLARSAGRRLFRYVCAAVMPLGQAAGHGEAVRYYIRAAGAAR